jgi:L-histidine Nalpha-methyltransferase
VLTELPASALYSHPSLGRLWKKVHLSCSPFLHRTELQRLYRLPSTRIRKHFGRRSYSLLALGCADGTKESLLLKKLPKPTSLLALDTNLSLARRAARRLPAFQKSAHRADLTSSPSLQFLSSRLKPHPTLITLFGVLPNLNPLPLLRSIRRFMKKEDLLLFSANLAPGQSSHDGALRILPQYDNRPTRNWLEAAILRNHHKLPKGHLEFGVFPDPKQKTLARIEARWMSNQQPIVVFSSRRPTQLQVESWIQASGLRRLKRWIDPRGEEGVWLVQPSSDPASFSRDPNSLKR